MSDSKIDKRVKNARLAVARARAGRTSERYLEAVENELQQALARKEQMKVMNR